MVNVDDLGLSNTLAGLIHLQVHASVMSSLVWADVVEHNGAAHTGETVLRLRTQFYADCYALRRCVALWSVAWLCLCTRARCT